MIRLSGTGATQTIVLRLSVLPARGHIRARLVQMHVLVDMIDPRHRNKVMVLAGQAGVTAGAIAAFDRALRTVMLVTALCAALGSVAGWLWVRPRGSEPLH